MLLRTKLVILSLSKDLLEAKDEYNRGKVPLTSASFDSRRFLDRLEMTAFVGKIQPP